VTDALYNATKSTEPIPAKETFPQGKETSPQGTVINETSTKATAVPVTVEETPSTSTSQSDPVVAKPIVGPHKRGRSKKRK
jgi:hypothetical protein